MAEARDTQIRRLNMRSMRRGIKEMDLILSAFAAAELKTMTAQELNDYEVLLHENDQDLYAWLLGRGTPPDDIRSMLERIKSTLPGN